jgi:polyisoprenoid-binding protein YceI
MGELPAGDWVVDCARSRVGFSLKHMLMSTVKGSFHDFAGTLSVSDGTAQAQGSVEVVSLDTGERVRDEHVLNSADFFDLATHPQIGFRSTRVELDRRRLKVIGPLSIRGNSHEVQLEGQIDRVAPEPGVGMRAEISLRGEIERSDFGLVWNQALDTGGLLLGSKVKIALEIVAVNATASGA